MIWGPVTDTLISYNRSHFSVPRQRRSDQIMSSELDDQDDRSDHGLDPLNDQEHLEDLAGGLFGEGSEDEELEYGNVSAVNLLSKLTIQTGRRRWTSSREILMMNNSALMMMKRSSTAMMTWAIRGMRKHKSELKQFWTLASAAMPCQNLAMARYTDFLQTRTYNLILTNTST